MILNLMFIYVLLSVLLSINNWPLHTNPIHSGRLITSLIPNCTSSTTSCSDSPANTPAQHHDAINPVEDFLRNGVWPILPKKFILHIHIFNSKQSKCGNLFHHVVFCSESQKTQNADSVTAWACSGCSRCSGWLGCQKSFLLLRLSRPRFTYWIIWSRL